MAVDPCPALHRVGDEFRPIVALDECRSLVKVCEHHQTAPMSFTCMSPNPDGKHRPLLAKHIESLKIRSIGASIELDVMVLDIRYHN